MTLALEYGKIFQIRVYVNEICATLKDYNFEIEYKAELLKLTGVDWTGSVLEKDEGEHYTESTPGIINVVDPGGTTWKGLTNGLLFTLTFHIEFTDAAEHIWRTNNQGTLHAFIKFTGATLSFEEGIIPMSGITMPSDLDRIVNLIQGDIDCDGKVNVLDLHTVAAYYDQTTPVKYDLTKDGIIDIFDLVAVATNFGYGGS